MSDIRFIENIVFGSLSVSLSAVPASISPRLPFAEAGAIIEDGEPNLMSALRWEYGLTATLRGREADLDAVLGWAEGGGNTVSVRLVSGPGGAGKTRLAAEAARRLRERGWCAGFLPRDARHGQVIDASGRAGGGLLLVIDYPEERPGLVEELFEARRRSRQPADPDPLPAGLAPQLRGLAAGRPTCSAAASAGRSSPRPGRWSRRMPWRCCSEAAERFAELTGAAAPPLDGAEAWLARAPVNRLRADGDGGRHPCGADRPRRFRARRAGADARGSRAASGRGCGASRGQRGSASSAWSGCSGRR